MRTCSVGAQIPVSMDVIFSALDLSIGIAVTEEGWRRTDGRSG